ncbi:hypothetical protein K2173_003809 [Erythroxylum novogranatense]|uniref:Protein BCCIP homolog n=1 Tax=Erythroxylum novogranatense TaxID=1862640 RepID=A0AAV8SIU8_9ROSI|nr:hypothetical protein K2173_003809 [Erythroxylum novogranatense]
MIVCHISSCDVLGTRPTMPRKPVKRYLSLISQPVTFSQFSRSVTFLASAYMNKRQMLNHKLLKSVPRSPGNGLTGHILEESSDSSGFSEEEENEFVGVVQADFAFFDPKSEDFHGVRILLQTYLDNEKWDLSGFVDLILEQTTVGTVVKVEDDEDGAPFSIITALNLGRYKEHKCIMELREFLLKVCLEKSVKDDLMLLLRDEAQNVGLLVSQRVVNLPLQLLPPLYDALFDEVSWATEDEPTEELRKSFGFRHYLLICKVYKQKNSDGKKRQSLHADKEIIFVKPDDEVFYKLCLWSFSFPLHSKQVTSYELKDYRPMGLVMTVEADKVPIFREKLHSLIDES